MKTLSILGTRPELIKMSEIIKKLDKHTEHIFVHTGQNYDYELNEIFYKDLGLRKPDYYLDCGGGSLAETYGKVLVEVEKVLIKEKPDAVVILGDTNSAIGGIIAKRMKIPLFHLEAGNRCFDDNVPEEINRRIIDHIADVNMVYTQNQRKYLTDEGLAKDRIFVMGSPMKEVLFGHAIEIESSDVRDRMGLIHRGSAEVSYFVANLHRDENTEIQENLDKLVESLNAIADKYEMPIILSAHPRLRKKIEEQDIKFNSMIRILKPLGFFDYVHLQKYAKCVISDSGTIAEESSILDFPAITIRNAVERPEAIDEGSLIMSGVNKESVLNCLEIALNSTEPNIAPFDYDVDNCSERVLRVILGYTPYVNRYVWRKR